MYVPLPLAIFFCVNSGSGAVRGVARDFWFIRGFAVVSVFRCNGGMVRYFIFRLRFVDYRAGACGRGVGACNSIIKGSHASWFAASTC